MGTWVRMRERGRRAAVGCSARNPSVEGEIARLRVLGLLGLARGCLANPLPLKGIRLAEDCSPTPIRGLVPVLACSGSSLLVVLGRWVPALELELELVFSAI